MKLTHCPSTLAAGYETYSPIALKNLFAGKKVSHILPYDSPEKNEEDNEKFIENIEHISISGVQDKEVCLVEKGKITPIAKGRAKYAYLEAYSVQPFAKSEGDSCKRKPDDANCFTGLRN